MSTIDELAIKGLRKGVKPFTLELDPNPHIKDVAWKLFDGDKQYLTESFATVDPKKPVLSFADLIKKSTDLPSSLIFELYGSDGEKNDGESVFASVKLTKKGFTSFKVLPSGDPTKEKPAESKKQPGKPTGDNPSESDSEGADVVISDLNILDSQLGVGLSVSGPARLLVKLEEEYEPNKFAERFSKEFASQGGPATIPFETMKPAPGKNHYLRITPRNEDGETIGETAEIVFHIVDGKGQKGKVPSSPPGGQAGTRSQAAERVTLKDIVLMPDKLAVLIEADADADIRAALEDDSGVIWEKILSVKEGQQGKITLSGLPVRENVTSTLTCVPVDPQDSDKRIGEQRSFVFHMKEDKGVVGKAQPKEPNPAAMRRVDDPENLDEIEELAQGRPPAGGTRSPRPITSTETRTPITRPTTGPWNAWLLGLVAVLIALVVLSTTLPVKEWTSKANQLASNSGTNGRTLPPGSFTADNADQSMPTPTRVIEVPAAPAVEAAVNNYGGQAMNSISISGSNNVVIGPLIVNNQGGCIKTNVDICSSQPEQTNAVPAQSEEEPRIVTPPMVYIERDSPDLFFSGGCDGQTQVVIGRNRRVNPFGSPIGNRYGYCPPPQNHVWRGGGQPGRGIHRGR